MSKDEYKKGVSIYLPNSFVLRHKVIPKKTLIKRKCKNCNQRKTVAYMDIIVFMQGESISKYLCNYCGEDEIDKVIRGEKIQLEQISKGHFPLW